MTAAVVEDQAEPQVLTNEEWRAQALARAGRLTGDARATVVRLLARPAADRTAAVP